MSDNGEQLDTQEMVRLNIPRVNRDEQIDKFHDALNSLRKDPLPTSLKTILEWYGAPGMGKSFLVNMLYGECRAKSIPAALINFRHHPERETLYVNDPAVLVAKIAGQIFESGSTFAEQFNAAYRTYQQRIESARPPEPIVKRYFQLTYDERFLAKPNWLTELEHLMQEFKASVLDCARASESAAVVLFFDETDWVEQIELIDWIEESIINPLTQARRCVVVWTARRPWRWKLPDVRVRLDLMELKAFDEDQTGSQIRLLVDNIALADDFFKKVRKLTGGNPYANRVVSEHFVREQPNAEINSLTFQQLLSRSVFEEFIQNYAFDRFDPQVREAFKLLAMVRTFDTTMMREVLTSCSKMFAESRQEDFGELLLRLKRSQLVLWDKGHRLENTLREIISQYHYDCERDMYIAVNQTALKVYQRWLNQPVDNRSLYMIEELYHQACLVYAGRENKLEQEFNARLDEYAKRFKDNPTVRDKAFEYLYGEISNDTSLQMQVTLVDPTGKLWQSLLAQSQPTSKQIDGITT